MTLIDLPKRSWVLIEGPAPADARFLGQWLLAAAEADTLLQAQLEHDRSFKRSVSSILLLHCFAFSPTAIYCVELLMKNRASFSLSVFDLSGCGLGIAVMAKLGFFLLTGERYQMAVPKELTREKIKTALLSLMATLDENDFLYPDRLLHCISQPAAREVQFGTGVAPPRNAMVHLLSEFRPNSDSIEEPH